MQSFSYHIAGQLSKEGACTLPGIGHFSFASLPAHRPAGSSGFEAPQLTILFEESVRKESTHRLPVFAAHQENMELSGMESLWEAQQKAWKEKLNNGSALMIPGIGTLLANEEGNIHFQQTGTINRLFPPVQVPPMARKKTETVPAEVTENVNVGQPDADPFPDQKPSLLMRYWWAAAGGVILVAALVFFLLNTHHPDEGKEPLQAPAAIQQPDAHRDTATRQTANTALTPDSVHYHIVISAYNNKFHAEKQYKKMKNWGHPVELLTGNNGKFLMAMPFTSLPEDTTINLVKMMKTYGPDVFIVYP